MEYTQQYRGLCNMIEQRRPEKLTLSGLSEKGTMALSVIILCLLLTGTAYCSEWKAPARKVRTTPLPKSELDLKEIPFKIVHETFHKTDGRENWELRMINADGSNPINLTNTPNVDEMYPHVSPDGTKISFVVDERTENGKKIRNVYYMNIDGSGRVKVADNARQQCWNPDSKTIAYLKSEFERYTTKDYAASGLFYYDLKTGQHRQHPNKKLHHLYNICCSPDGKWFVATVHGGMGFRHANLAFEADGNKVYDLNRFEVKGCRPDFSPEGKRITWGRTDWDLCTGEIDFTGPEPQVRKVKYLIKCDKEYEIYHTDFSPDGKYITFSYGPKAGEAVGTKAPGWNICISDLNGKWVQITSDGLHNKEPDWVPITR